MKKIISIFILALCCYVSLNAQIITTVAGTGNSVYNGDGMLATNANISSPGCVAVDEYGNIYVSSDVDQRIRKIDVRGIITTIAGNSIAGYNGDEGMATDVQLNYPRGICVVDDRGLYICDTRNYRICKVYKSGIIKTIAGNGESGYEGDGGAATNAKMSYPYSVCVDASGNVYVVDIGNATIRKITNDGMIVTIAGTGAHGYNGDDIPATDAMINKPREIALDNYGAIYFSDAGNRRIRKIEKSGKIKTVAGNGASGYSGDKGPATNAQLSVPFGLTFDNENNMYFSDVNGSYIRKVNTSGIISTIAGTGSNRFGGDGKNAIHADMKYPYSLAFDYRAGLLIADNGNNRIRRISNIVAAVDEMKSEELGITILPNPCNGTFILDLPSISRETFHVSVTDMLGNLVSERALGHEKQAAIN